MKKLFRKAMNVAGSAALIGATVGMAAAAAYPMPFTSNTAIVVGANAAPADNIAAASIASNLDANAAGSGAVTVTGGEVFALGKSSDEFQLGYNLGSVYSDLDDNDMPSFLADGNFDDGDIDEDYSQTITLGTSTNLGLFADNDYDDAETPTLGFHFDDDLIMSYTIAYDTALTDYSDLEDTDMPLMGNEYYVLDADSAELVLLDSADKTIVTEGETVTIGDKTVSIAYIDADAAKFTVNGETTDKIYDDASNGDKYYELEDESYIVLSENLYASKDTGISKAEISIGKGKIALSFDGDEVEINDEPVDGLTSTITTDGSTAITGVATDNVKDITISWYADGEEFLIEGGSMTMPGFETMKLLFEDIGFPSTSESISLDKGDTVTLDMGNFEVEILDTTDATSATQGGDGHLLKNVATAATDSLTFYLADDERFIATYLDTDLSDVEQLYYEASNLDVTGASDDEFSLDLEDLTDGNKDISFDAVDAADDDTSRGDVTVTLEMVFEAGAVVNATGTNTATFMNEATAAAINATTPTAFNGGNATAGDVLLDDVAKVTVTHEDGENLYFDMVVSETGLVVEIPNDIVNLDDADNYVTFYEASDDGDLQWTTSTSYWQTDLQYDTTDDYAYAAKGSVLSFEEVSDDKYVAYKDGDLASKVNVDEDSDTYEVTYYGDEVVADVSVASADAVVTSTDVGVMTVKDSEVATVAGKNLVVVGGSAINSVAAELLGGAYSEAVFTAETGVSAGEFLIQSFDRSGTTALLVAGYNAADTEKAATYLLNNDVDTTVGTKMKGTSATEATVVTA